MEPDEAMTELERRVMEKLLSGDHPALAVLRAQLAASRVAARRMSGVGFFTTFEVDPRAPPLAHDTGNAHFGDVAASMAGLAHGAGFVVFIERGYIRTLEGYSYDEAWPERAELVELNYFGREPRDLSALERSRK